MNAKVRNLYNNYSPTKYTKEHEKKIIFVFFRVFCGLSQVEIPCSSPYVPPEGEKGGGTVKLTRHFKLALMFTFIKGE